MPVALRRSLWSVNRFPKSPAILNGLRLLFVKGDNTLYSSNTTLEYDECKTHRTARRQRPLSQFTGTAQYWRVARQFAITDGVKYLAETAACFWLIDAAISHLLEIGTADWFVLVRTEVSGSQATMIYEDGNGLERARQAIPYTDLQLPSVESLRSLGQRALGHHAAQ